MSITIIVRKPKARLVSMAEVPKNGRRMLRTERITPEGNRTITFEDVKQSTAPAFVVPAAGMCDEEVRERVEEQWHKRGEKPSDKKLEWMARNAAKRDSLPQRYSDYTQARAEEHVGRRRFLAAKPRRKK